MTNMDFIDKVQQFSVTALKAVHMTNMDFIDKVQQFSVTALNIY